MRKILFAVALAPIEINVIFHLERATATGGPLSTFLKTDLLFIHASFLRSNCALSFSRNKLPICPFQFRPVQHLIPLVMKINSRKNIFHGVLNPI